MRPQAARPQAEIYGARRSAAIPVVKPEIREIYRNETINKFKKFELQEMRSKQRRSSATGLI